MVPLAGWEDLLILLNLENLEIYLKVAASSNTESILHKSGLYSECESIILRLESLFEFSKLYKQGFAAATTSPSLSYYFSKSEDTLTPYSNCRCLLASKGLFVFFLNFA